MKKKIMTILLVIIPLIITVPAYGGVLSTTIQPSTKDLTFQSKCGADYKGKEGSTRNLTLQNSMAWLYCWKYDGLVEFDLTPISDIPADNIISAELHLYQWRAIGHHGDPWVYDFYIEVYPNTEPWGEETTWYYDQPSFDSGYTNKILITTELGWKIWNITAIVKDWQSGVISNYGLRVFTVDNPAANLDSTANFYSREEGGELVPKIVIQYEEPVKEIIIDIKPGSDPNSINVSSAGVIPVAILSSDTFDATQVDPATCNLAGASVRVAGKSDSQLCHAEDVNGDGLQDLTCQFENDLIAEEGDSIAVLEGETFDGTPFRGEGTIRIVPDN
jgi:hypothetical protein